MARKKFSKEIKEDAINMVLNGRPIKVVAKKFSTTENSIRTWIKVSKERGYIKPKKTVKVVKSSDYFTPKEDYPTVENPSKHIDAMVKEINNLRDENTVLLRLLLRRG